ncbi:MAG: hypothetical protein ACR2LL_06760 [Nitrosopumilus sp.]
MSNTLTQNNPYVPRFEKLLKSLQSKLSKLEIKLDSIDNDHPDKQQSRLNVLEEMSKTKQEIQITEKNLECSKTMKGIRSDKVPNRIEDHNVWNDCWYDEERKLYVTYCKYFQEIPGAKDRPHQLGYTKETGNEGIVIVPEDVEFRFGYPAVKQKNSKDQNVWFLLSTMLDDMLTDEIVLSRLRPNLINNALLYYTKSEQWITVGTDGFSMCEKENEISDKYKVFPPVPIEELKVLYGRN